MNRAWGFSALAVLMFAAQAGAGFAAERPAVKDCMEAYALADSFRAEVRGMEAKPGEGSFRGLSTYVEGFWSTDFEARGRDLQAKHANKDDGGYFDAQLTVHGRSQDLLMESINGPLASMVTPDKVFTEQRKVMNRVRACDLAYGYKPVLGEPPTPEKTVALLKSVLDKKVDEKNARLAALDDMQCAIRFVLAGNMFPAGSSGQQAMLQRLQVAGPKAIAARPNVTEERLMTEIKRGVEERASKLKSGSYKAETIVEEVNECERRLGLPKTDIKLAGG